MQKLKKICCSMLLAISLESAPSALAEICNIPHVIANGQIADASKVMDNFDAVANCAERAVTTTGAPTTGSVTVFSGAGTVATGNLTGDVTTSGSTATTLSNSGVTPGTYTSANIIVDAKGRVISAANGSGGGGGSWWFHPPSASQFTTGSGSSTFLTLTDDVDAGLLVDGGAPTTGDVQRIAYQTLANKNSPWDLKVRISAIVDATNWSGVGIMTRDSISGRIVSITQRGDGYIAVNKWNGWSGYAGSIAAIFPRTTVNWLRINFDGTNCKFYVSAEGKIWIEIASASSTGWLSNNADQVGLVIDYNRNGPIKNTMAVEYYSLDQ